MTTIAILHAIHDVLGPDIPASVGIQQVVPITIAPARYQLGTAHDIDWQTDARKQHEAVIRDLVPQLAAHPDVKLAYFGAAPIPHAMHLGTELAKVAGWTPVKVYQRQHVTGAWAWSSDELTSAAEPKKRGLPHDKVQGVADVVVRISMRNQVEATLTAEVVPQASAIDIETTFDSDTLRSSADLDRIGDAFVEVMDAVARLRPGATVHLFAAIPVGVAFTLGLRLSPTQHPPVYVYQYKATRTPRNERALLLNALEPRRVELSSDELAAIPDLRRRFASALRHVQDLAGEIGERSWWQEVTRGKGTTPRHAKLVAFLPTCRSIVGTHIDPSSPHSDLDGFAYDSATRSWRFTDDLLTQFARRFQNNAGELEAAARLFFLHEGLHDCHGLTSTTATSIGRFPKVVEDLDYEADIWAMLHEYRWAQTYDKGPLADIRRYFITLADRMLESFWAFDDRGVDLTDMPVRRVNRYLIWYWQRIALENVDSIDDVLTVLRDKPVIELTGPRVRIIADRVSFLLGPNDHEPPELAFISRRGTLKRVSTGPAADLRALISGFRSRSSETILTALRGARDVGEAH